VFSGFPLAPFLQARPDPALRARLGLTGSEFVVGTIARLFKLKGHDELLAAATAVVARSPQARFLWVGDGAWRARLVAEAARRGLARHILFAGLVAPEAVPEYLALMDVVVHLSRREGLPRALPQAMAAGRPVIAYALDGAPEVCRDGETGFLLEPGDLDTLARRLLDLAADRDLGLRLGQRGRELATAWFPVERMIDALHELYVRLLATAAAPARS
jgi:glycosyltransferase involved in cell wall biosynthesis